MLLISKDEVSDVLTLTETIDAVDEAFHRWDGANVPERIQMDTDTGELFVMPGEMGTGEFGLKTVTLFSGNDEHGLPRTLGTIIIFDSETGAMEAILDGTRITNYRTGAIGAVAARYLAPPTTETVTIFGSSTQGRYQARALDAELDLETIYVYSRSSMKHKAVTELQSELTATVEATDSPESACRSADIVVTATTAPVPVFDDTDIEPGTLVIGVGSNTPDMREIPGETVEHTEAVYTDDYESCLATGDLADAIAEGYLEPASVQTIASLVNSEPPYRTSDSAVYVVKSVGSILLDIHVSNLVFGRVQSADLGTRIDLQGLQ